jgi:hypothetical protein
MSAEPLDVESGLAEPPADRGALKPIKETTPMERLAGIVAGIAIVTSLAAIVIEQSAIVILAGLLSSAMGPYAYWQQTRLTDIKALQETHEAVQIEVDRLHSENERLNKTIGELSSTVERLEDVEQALDTISKTQGKSVAAFAEQVEKNKEILLSMKVGNICAYSAKRFPCKDAPNEHKSRNSHYVVVISICPQANLKGTVMQNLLSVVMASDQDKDMLVDQEEVDTLIKRIEGIGGVTVKEDKFRAAFAGNSVSSLMNIVSNLLRDDVKPEDQIFILTKK